MDKEKAISYWLDMARYDLETAHAMLHTSRFLYVGFMAHQAMEKTLKAFHWVSKASEAPYTHDLWKLVNTSGLEIPDDSPFSDLLDELQPLNVAARYPKDKDRILASLNTEYCAALLKRTERMLEWLQKKF